MLRHGIAPILVGLLAGPSMASVCDYRLGEMIAARAPALAAEAADQALLGQLAGTPGGFFTLVDSRGMTALGGMIAGSAGARAAAGVADAAAILGLGGTVVSSPMIGMAAGAAVVGMAGLEGICRFQDERITDYYEVLSILSAVAETADPRLFQLQLGAARKKAAVAEIWDPEDGVRRQYRVADLFFVNGELKLNRLGLNRSLGYLVQFRGDAPVLDTPPLNAFGP